MPTLNPSWSLRRRDPARSMARFYRCQLQPDLGGGISLVREWGRIGSPGTVLAESFADEPAALAAALRLILAKRRKGYA